MLRKWLFPALALIAATPAVACESGPLKIFYAPGSARLSASELGEVEDMAFKAGRHGFVRLAGHSDTAGPAQANLRLSDRRVKGVRDALVAAGIAPRRILAESFGESRSIAALDDGRAEREHRYVLIEILTPGEAAKGRGGRARRGCNG
ncbi:MAG TPA: OmpA family protein [Allosphingosinicella sp.]|jgi:outer membrane protein OmpA-like peptidoglycan-associated protein